MENDLLPAEPAIIEFFFGLFDHEGKNALPSSGHIH